MAPDYEFQPPFHLLLLQSGGSNHEKTEIREHHNIGAPNAERTQGYLQNCPYAVAKTGVVVFSKSLAKEEAKYGIRVNVINPGFIQTDEYTEEMKKDMPKQVPLERLGKPEDIANAVLFLVSDEANYITGSVLNVHGGLWC